jgi:hypothetical protein
MARMGRESKLFHKDFENSSAKILSPEIRRSSTPGSIPRFCKIPKGDWNER